ncbi:hypothetical protein B0H11DRAFT_2226949 [Mycena galericulata]|nr:hypothetical protein B0H11DRAFT_2226949 [Mycena galericulata]
MAVPLSTAPDVFRGSDESGIHWSTVGDLLVSAAILLRAMWRSLMQPAASIRRRFLKTSRLSHVVDSLHLADNRTSRLQDFRIPRLSDDLLSLDSSTFGRPALQDSRLPRRSDGLSSRLLAPSTLSSAWCLNCLQSPSTASRRAVFAPRHLDAWHPYLPLPLLALDRHRLAPPSLHPTPPPFISSHSSAFLDAWTPLFYSPLFHSS